MCLILILEGDPDQFLQSTLKTLALFPNIYAVFSYDVCISDYCHRYFTLCLNTVSIEFYNTLPIEF